MKARGVRCYHLFISNLLIDSPIKEDSIDLLYMVMSRAADESICGKLSHTISSLYDARTETHHGTRRQWSVLLPFSVDETSFLQCLTFKSLRPTFWPVWRKMEEKKKKISASDFSLADNNITRLPSKTILLLEQQKNKQVIVCRKEKKYFRYYFLSNL